MKKTLVPLVLALAVVMAPTPTHASILSDVQAELQGIVSKIHSLQNQLVPKAVTNTAPGNCAVLTHNMGEGAIDVATDSEVSKLQQALVVLYPETSVSGTYGPATTRAVIRYQKAHGILGTGVVGPATRAALGQACSGLASVTITKKPAIKITGGAVVKVASFDVAPMTSTSAWPTFTGTANVDHVGIVIVDSTGTGLAGTWGIPVEGGHWSYSCPVSLKPGNYTVQLTGGEKVIAAKLTVSS